MWWQRLARLWRRHRGLRRDIALIIVVKALLLAVLINTLAVPKAQRRVGPEGAGRHLLGSATPATKEPTHER